MDIVSNFLPKSSSNSIPLMEESMFGFSPLMTSYKENESLQHIPLFSPSYRNINLFNATTNHNNNLEYIMHIIWLTKGW